MVSVPHPQRKRSLTPKDLISQADDQRRQHRNKNAHQRSGQNGVDDNVFVRGLLDNWQAQVHGGNARDCNGLHIPNVPGHHWDQDDANGLADHIGEEGDGAELLRVVRQQDGIQRVPAKAGADRHGVLERNPG